MRKLIKQELSKENAPSVAVAVFKDGQIDWEEGFGWANKEKKVRATRNTIYSLASISKPITATALMKLAGEGTVNVDRPIDEYLGGAKVTVRVGAAQHVTVRRVANHMAGLPLHVQFFYEGEPVQPPAPDVTISRYGNIVREPGTHYLYSNLGYGLLSRVIEVQSHQSYAEYMRRQVFAPLGMTRTAVNPTSALDPNVAIGYNLDGTPIARFVTDHPGASEVYSSAHDLIRFAAFHLKAGLPDQAAILDDAAIDSMHAPANGSEGYGFGFNVATRSGYRVVSHGGDMPGVATQMLLVPSKGVAIVVLANSMRHDMVARITDAMAASVLPGWEPEGGPTPTLLAAEPFAPSAEIIGTWTGLITRPEGTLPMTIKMGADGGLTAAVDDQPPTMIKGAKFKDGDLTGLTTGSVRTNDVERYKYSLFLVLHRDGTRLYGTTTALDDVSPSNKHIVAGLSYWTDLTRQP